jgi:cytochrome c2
LDPSSSGKHSTGPALGLIYGSPVGADVNFTSYTPNMLKSNMFWTSLNLFSFIKKPGDFIKGSKCNFIKGGL